MRLRVIMRFRGWGLVGPLGVFGSFRLKGMKGLPSKRANSLFIMQRPSAQYIYSG